MPYVTVKRRHQVTIPAKLRDRLPVSEGDLLEVTIEGGSFVLTPKQIEDRAEEQLLTSARSQMRLKNMNTIAKRFRALSVRDARDIDALLYNENGLPK